MSAHVHIGNVLDARGDRTGAREVYYRARSLIREAFGEDHPRVGHVEFNLARLAMAEGRLDEAREHLDVASSIYLRTLGHERREQGDREEGGRRGGLHRMPVVRPGRPKGLAPAPALRPTGGSSSHYRRRRRGRG